MCGTLELGPVPETATGVAMSFTCLTPGSRMTDTITVASPIFGSLAERLVLVPYLRRLIATRNAHLLNALS